MTYETIRTRIEAGKVGVVTLHRPDQLNALSDQLLDELAAALKAFDADEAIGCIVLAGNERAFAAGGDIGDMAKLEFADVYGSDAIGRRWDSVRAVRKPIVAAVSGYALGGGCELAMMCDIVIAADNARFGQPEIKLGTIPGAGGTQRLPRAIGKAKAMDLVLTARMIKADEAERWGLVSRVVPLQELMAEAIATGIVVAEMPRLAAIAAKESVNRAFESGLADGIWYERRLFHALSSTEDQKEGMEAFVAKRKPEFRNK